MKEFFESRLTIRMNIGEVNEDLESVIIRGIEDGCEVEQKAFYDYRATDEGEVSEDWFDQKINLIEQALNE